MMQDILDKGFSNSSYTFAIVRKDRNDNITDGYNKEESKDIIITYSEKMVLPSGTMVIFDYVQNAIKAINAANGFKNKKEDWKDAFYYTKKNNVIIIEYKVYYIIVAPVYEE